MRKKLATLTVGDESEKYSCMRLKSNCTMSVCNILHSWHILNAHRNYFIELASILLFSSTAASYSIIIFRRACLLLTSIYVCNILNSQQQTINIMRADTFNSITIVKINPQIIKFANIFCGTFLLLFIALRTENPHSIVIDNRMSIHINVCDYMLSQNDDHDDVDGYS